MSRRESERAEYMCSACIPSSPQALTDTHTQQEKGLWTEMIQTLSGEGIIKQTMELEYFENLQQAELSTEGGKACLILKKPEVEKQCVLICAALQNTYVRGKSKPFVKLSHVIFFLFYLFIVENIKDTKLERTE